MSSEEDDQLERLDEKETQFSNEPLDTDLNALFQIEEDMFIGTHSSEPLSQEQPCDIPAHLKSVVGKCKLFLV